MGNSKKETARSLSLEDVGTRQLSTVRRQGGTPQKKGFLLSQNEFVDELKEIQISSQRRKEKDSTHTARTKRTERTQGWFGLEM